MKRIAIIPIGGSGIRMNNKIPKQFIKINDKTLYIYTLEKFQNNESIDEIVVVCLNGYQKEVERECKQYGITKLKKVVLGGQTQLASIFNGISAIETDLNDDDIVMIHVGNRPNVSQKLISTCIAKYNEVGALTTVLPCIEVMVDKENNDIIPRNNIVRIQTPQVFSYKDLKEFVLNSEYYIDRGNTVCDLMLSLNKTVEFIEGEFLNFKITYPEDLYLFEKIISN